MREILFRGKRIDNRKWAYGYYAGPVSSLDTHDIFDIEDCAGIGCEVNPHTIGQYTGLTDKNGVKIFEGDVLLIGDFPKPVLIEFINFSWECTSKSIGPYYRHRLEGNGQKYEVIGNIHDNPDLINES